MKDIIGTAKELAPSLIKDVFNEFKNKSIEFKLEMCCDRLVSYSGSHQHFANTVKLEKDDAFDIVMKCIEDKEKESKNQIGKEHS